MDSLDNVEDEFEDDPEYPPEDNELYEDKEEYELLRLDSVDSDVEDMDVDIVERDPDISFELVLELVEWEIV